MSVRLMSRVWDLDVDHPQQSVLMVLADHANDAGEQLYPSQAQIAWKTGYSERHVRRVMKELREMGAVVPLSKPSAGRTIRYRLALEGLPTKVPWVRDPEYHTGQDDRREDDARRPPRVGTPVTPDRDAGHSGSARRSQLRPPIHQNHHEPPEPPVALATRSVVDRMFDDEFWPVYPRRSGKLKAREAFAKALRNGASPAEVIAGARRYAEDPNREEQFTKHPTTWLNQGCWEDDPLPARSNGKGVTAQQMAQKAVDDRDDESGPVGVAEFVGAAMAVAGGGSDEEERERRVGGHDSRGLPEPGDA